MTRSRGVLARISGVMSPDPSRTTCPTIPGMVLVSVDPEDLEANAAAMIVVMKIQSQVLQFAKEGFCNLANYDADENEAQARLIVKSRAVLVVLSRGTMQSTPQLISIIEAASASAGGGPAAIPVCTPSFTFPSSRYYTLALPKIMGSRSDVLAPKIQSFFRTIAVTLSIAASDQVIQAQAESIIARIPHAFDISNSQGVDSFLEEHN